MKTLREQGKEPVSTGGQSGVTEEGKEKEKVAGAKAPRVGM